MLQMTQTTLGLASSPELHLCPLGIMSKMWFAVLIWSSCKSRRNGLLSAA